MLKFTRIDEECWIWIGSSRGNGYGDVTIKNKTYRIHRLSAHLFLGLDLDNPKMQANHKCKNRRCWNPDHLYVGNQCDNIADSVEAKTHNPPQNKSHCPKGHKFTPENTYLYNNIKHCKECQSYRDRWRTRGQRT